MLMIEERWFIWPNIHFFNHNNFFLFQAKHSRGQALISSKFCLRDMQGFVGLGKVRLGKIRCYFINIIFG
jgi:hypothetical protein